MKRSVFSPASIVMLLISLMLVFSCISVGAEEPEVPVEDQSGWMGVYIGGNKVGFSHWTIEKKTAGKREYYRMSLTEERSKEVKGKEVKSIYEFEATLTLALELRTLNYKEKVAGRTTTVKGKVKNSKAEMVVSFGSKPLPVKKLKIKEGTSWAFCAPLAWAWRSLTYDKQQLFNRIYEKSSTFKSTKVNGVEKKVSFEGEDVDSVFWSDEEGKLSIVTDGAGKLFWFSQKSKKGVETKYVCENEDLARSSMNYEQYVAKKKKKPGKKGKKGKKGGDDSPFDNPLEPVDDDADVCNKGDYFKLKIGQSGMVMTIRAADGWVCTPAKIQNRTVFVVVNKEEQSIALFLIPSNSDGDEADVILEDVISQIEDSGDVSKVKYLGDEEIAVFEQGEKEFAYAKISMIMQNSKNIAYFLAMPGDGDSLDLTFRCIVPASMADEYEDDIHAMFGSARYVEE